MRALKCLFPIGVLLFAQGAAAQMQPHRAEYVLRLGSAVNAPRIGTATEDVTSDCEAWHLTRNVKGELPISTSLKFDVASRLVSRETRSGNQLHFRSRLTQNGAEREVRGSVRRDGEELRAEIESPDGPSELPLPAPTRMPVSSIVYVIDALRSGLASFSLLSFDAQGSGEAFRADVKQIDGNALRRRLTSAEPVQVPGRSWPVQISLTRMANDKTLFGLTGRLFESGVLDHVTVNADPVTVAADLTALDIHASPSCH